MTQGSKLETKLTLKRESGWTKLDTQREKSVAEFCEGYKKFLFAKTERECVAEVLRIARRHGFKKSGAVKPGTRFYFINRDKNVALLVVGKDKLEKGLNIIVSHIDAPRIDLKQQPLYEDKDTEIALLKTHYYGGIKKYQWANVPLSLHGKIIKRDGSALELCIGEKENEPIFTIPDLLIHLAKEQMERKLAEGLKGEELNIPVGTIPIDDKKAKSKVKLAILDHLNRRYGLTEEDFISAEIEAVPTHKPRDVGLDRSMVGAYGQDDRVCAYTSLMAICEVTVPQRTSLVLFVDKEEIGSEGNTSMKSRFMENVISNFGEGARLREALTNSKALSADVNGAMSPTFKDVHEPTNAAKLGFGVVITKYTGSRGKYTANDASAEYVGKVRKLFNDNDIIWQAAELGKVDLGGGGTVAKYVAQYNMDVLDCGTPILSMHSPFELSSKLDVYATYEAYKVFLNADW